jgi:hypothetical protein
VHISTRGLQASADGEHKNVERRSASAHRRQEVPDTRLNQFDTTEIPASTRVAGNCAFKEASTLEKNHHAVPSRRPGLVVFTLIRGGPREEAFDDFVESRRCLLDAMPTTIQYDNIAFHEVNVPTVVQSRLSRQM